MIGKTVKVTKAVAAAGNYTANDVLSESASAGTAWIFQGMGGSGYLVKAQVICETHGQVQRLTLYLFDTLPTSVLNDNVANTAVLTADKDNYLGRIDFPSLEDLSAAGNSDTIATPSTSGNLPLAYYTKSPEDTLYAILVTRDAFTNETAGDDYTVILTMES